MGGRDSTGEDMSLDRGGGAERRSRGGVWNWGMREKEGAGAEEKSGDET